MTELLEYIEVIEDYRHARKIKHNVFGYTIIRKTVNRNDVAK